ncbi:hypothetical protein RB595_002102 [Gaeumannomyces hyphopodioides]
MPETYHGHPDFAFERNFKGYGEKGLKIKWPGNANIAVSFVINYEEGGERSVLIGDGIAEPNLREHLMAHPRINERDYSVESEYEYGSRAGFWRMFRLLSKHGLKFTLYAVAQALERNVDSWMLRGWSVYRAHNRVRRVSLVGMAWAAQQGARGTYVDKVLARSWRYRWRE